MCDADNHAVREAACQGVAELAQKVGTHPIYAECLSPYVTMLLQVSHPSLFLSVLQISNGNTDR
jgi:hypothetical protein